MGGGQGYLEELADLGDVGGVVPAGGFDDLLVLGVFGVEQGHADGCELVLAWWGSGVSISNV